MIILPKNSILVMGADLNTSISMRSTNSSSNVNENNPSLYLLGPHGNPNGTQEENSSLGCSTNNNLEQPQPSLTPTINVIPGSTLQQKNNINWTTF